MAFMRFYLACVSMWATSSAVAVTPSTGKMMRSEQTSGGGHDNKRGQHIFSQMKSMVVGHLGQLHIQRRDDVSDLFEEPKGDEVGNKEDPSETANVDLAFEELGCLPLRQDDGASVGVVPTSRDVACVRAGGLANSSFPCRSGFPFYRMVATDLDSSLCFPFCLEKGLDMFALVQGSANKSECRCGASTENSGIWSTTKRPSWLAALTPSSPSNSSKCEVIAFQYTGGFDANGKIPEALLRRKEEDDVYIHAVVTGHWVKHDERDVDEGGIDDDDDVRNSSLLSDGMINNVTNGCHIKETYWKKSSELPDCSGVSESSLCSCDVQKGQMISPCKKGGFTCVWGPAVKEPWPSGEVRYFLDDSMNDTKIEPLKQAMRAVSNRVSCITFKQIMSRDPAGHYLYVRDTDLTAPDSCSVMNSGNRRRRRRGSTISEYTDKVLDVQDGYYYAGPTILNYGWCKLGNVIHELGHVLGMMHTQKRRDAARNWVDPWGHQSRGPHLSINWDNILDEWKSQYTPDYYSYTGSGTGFAPFPEGGTKDPHTGYSDYDYKSVMHYPSEGEFTTGKGSNFDKEVGQRKGLSLGDMDELADMYSCNTDEYFIARGWKRGLHISFLHYKENSDIPDSIVVMDAKPGLQSWKTDWYSNGIDGWLTEWRAAGKSISTIKYQWGTGRWIAVAGTHISPTTHPQQVSTDMTKTMFLEWFTAPPGNGDQDHWKITDFAFGRGGYVGIKTSYYGPHNQRCHSRSDWTSIAADIGKDWGEGYSITLLDKLDGTWFVCSTVCTQGQAYRKRWSFPDVEKAIKELRDQSYSIAILLALPGSEYVVVANKVLSAVQALRVRHATYDV